MQVVLKPAGILLILTVIAILFWLVVSDQARLFFAPTGPPKEYVSVNKGKVLTNGAVASAAPVPVHIYTVDITRMGPTDWTVYGVIPAVAPAQSQIRKAVAQPAIAPVELLGKGVVSSYSNDPRPFRWSDGIPPNASAEDIRTGIVTAGIGSGFRVVVTPTVGKRQTLRVWVGGAGVRSKLHARMSDGSPISNVVESDNSIATGTGKLAFRSLYTIYFHASKPGQRLILSYLDAQEGLSGIGSAKDTSVESDVSLQAIALD